VSTSSSGAAKPPTSVLRPLTDVEMARILVQGAVIGHCIDDLDEAYCTLAPADGRATCALCGISLAGMYHIFRLHARGVGAV